MFVTLKILMLGDPEMIRTLFKFVLKILNALRLENF